MTVSFLVTERSGGCSFSSPCTQLSSSGFTPSFIASSPQRQRSYLGARIYDEYGSGKLLAVTIQHINLVSIFPIELLSFFSRAVAPDELSLGEVENPAIFPKRLHISNVAKAPDVAYASSPLPGSVIDLDVVMEHCDMSNNFVCQILIPKFTF